MTHGVMEMNLDCTNLKAYEPSRKLYQQLIRYPQEIIPLLDHTLTELVLDKYAADSSSFTENDMMKVRPFNLDRNVNLRELDPSGASTFCYASCNTFAQQINNYRH